MDQRPMDVEALHSAIRHIRGRHGHLWPDGSAGGKRGRRARDGLPGTGRRGEEGARDLVPVPAVHGAGSICRANSLIFRLSTSARLTMALQELEARALNNSRPGF